MTDTEARAVYQAVIRKGWELHQEFGEEFRENDFLQGAQAVLDALPTPFPRAPIPSGDPERRSDLQHRAPLDRKSQREEAMTIKLQTNNNQCQLTIVSEVEGVDDYTLNVTPREMIIMLEKVRRELLSQLGPDEVQKIKDQISEDARREAMDEIAAGIQKYGSLEELIRQECPSFYNRQAWIEEKL